MADDEVVPGWIGRPRPDRFSWGEGDLIMLAPCYTCVHKFLGEMKCTAFPNKIPLDIRTGDESHLEPYPGDNGIQWERDPEYEPGAFRTNPKLPEVQR